MLKKTKNFIVFLLLFSNPLFLGAQEEEGPGEIISQDLVMNAGSNGASAAGSSVSAQSFTGAVNYSLPLSVPKGILGHQPQIALNYNSQQSDLNSWVGYGWSLETGSIKRNLSEDSYTSNIGGQSEKIELLEENVDPSDYDFDFLNDLLSADPLNRNLGQVDLYQANPNTSSNIYLHIWSRPEPTKRSLAWILINKSGYYHYFGTNQQSRLSSLDQDGQSTTEWLLNAIVDNNNNSIHLFYQNKHLSQVQYADIEINFISDLADHYFPQNQELRFQFQDHVRLLRQIEISQNGNPLQFFYLSYERQRRQTQNFLASIQQCDSDGRDGECFEPTSFDYFDSHFPDVPGSPDFEDPQIVWSNIRSRTLNDSNYRMTAKRGDQELGFLNTKTQLADMNGDGLVDQVLTREGSDRIEIYFNNGIDFITDRPLHFRDPLFDVCEECRGELIKFDGERQILFLMDINGDALPDRIYREVLARDRARFKIAFNTGRGGFGPIVHWDDPFIGVHAGTVDEYRSFIDMNGDGLVDRVVKDDEGRCGFKVYKNTGAYFESDASFWADPYPFNSPGNDRGHCGKISAKNDRKVFLDIRDMNGDGLPDRVFRQKLYKEANNENWNEGWNYATVIVYNQSGKRWRYLENIVVNGLGCEPHTIECMILDGINAVALWDPRPDQNEEGYIKTDFREWIDFNKDGQLDRIIGEANAGRAQNEGRFHIYYNNGVSINNNRSFLTLANAIEVEDPLTDIRDAWQIQGKITGSDEGKIHTFFQDMNGDGYLDRVHLKQRVAYFQWDENDTKYQIFPFLTESIPVRSYINYDHPYPHVNQPAGKLKRIRDGYGYKNEVFYLPNTFRFDLAESPHRFLPLAFFNIFKSLSFDPLIPGQDNNNSFRETLYKFEGGNYYVRYPELENPNDPNNNVLSQKYFSAFNGYERMIEIQIPPVNESWHPIRNIFYHHQSQGDALPFPVMTPETDNHFALSGNLYKKESYYDEDIRIRETFEYGINWLPNNRFECNGVCQPQLLAQNKDIFEAGDLNARRSRNEFAYDHLGNIISTRSFDANGELLLEQMTNYFDESHFQDDLWIRDRPRRQIQQQRGEVYRIKDFEYDEKGNSTLERLHTGDNRHPFLDTIKEFDRIGNPTVVTKATGEQIEMIYDNEGVFLIEERRTLENNVNLSMSYNYHRLSGQVSREVNHIGVSKRVVYDSFGRILEEYVQGRDSHERLVRRFDYRIHQNFNVEGNLIGVSETKVWETNPDYPEMNLDENPISISYSLLDGTVLQSCQMTANGDYQIVLSRVKEGGRETIESETLLRENCEFYSFLPNDLRFTKTEKDFFGRDILVSTPPGDEGSPLEDISYFYRLDGAHLRKSTVIPVGLKMEFYDIQDRLIKGVDPAGNELEYFYNPVGDLLEVRQNGETLIETSYDLMGRKIETNHIENGRWTYSYDEKGFLERQVDSRGMAVEYDYVTNDRVGQKRVYDRQGEIEKTVTYTYDRGEGDYNVFPNQLYKVEERNGEGDLVHRVRFDYENDFGKLYRTSQFFSDLGELTQEIHTDWKGQVKSLVYPTGFAIYYKYLKTGSVKQICSHQSCDPNQGEVFYAIDENDFDRHGNLLRETLGNGIQNLYDYYDLSNRLERSQVLTDQENLFDRNYTYNAMSNIVSIRDNRNLNDVSGGYSQLTYDRLQRLTSFTIQEQDQAYDMDYSLGGNILRNPYAHDDQDYLYENDEKPYRLTSLDGRNYLYDENGNITRDGHRRMIYDGENHLSEVHMQNGNRSYFSYDYSGIRYLKRSLLRRGGRQVEVKNYYLGKGMEVSGDRLLVHLHIGDRKIATKGLGLLRDLRVASSSQLYKKAAIHYPTFSLSALLPFALLLFPLFFILLFHPALYRLLAPPDCRGHYSEILSTLRDLLRILKESIESFFRRPLKQAFPLFLIFLILFQWPFLNSAMAQAGPPLPQMSDEADFLIYYHNDHLGSASIITEGKERGRHGGFAYDKGQVIQHYEYSPFGEARYTFNAGLGLTPTFTGQPYDDSTGLHYYQSRYYDSSLGRFLQPDSLVPEAKNPQAYNPYAYVANNPINYTDPTGHSWQSFFSTLASFALGYVVSQISLPGLGFWGKLVFKTFMGASVGAISGGINGGSKGAKYGFLSGAISAAVSHVSAEVFQGGSNQSLSKVDENSSSAVKGGISEMSHHGVSSSAKLGKVTSTSIPERKIEKEVVKDVLKNTKSQLVTDEAKLLAADIKFDPFIISKNFLPSPASLNITSEQSYFSFDLSTNKIVKFYNYFKKTVKKSFFGLVKAVFGPKDVFQVATGFYKEMNIPLPEIGGYEIGGEIGAMIPLGGLWSVGGFLSAENNIINRGGFRLVFLGDLDAYINIKVADLE